MFSVAVLAITLRFLARSPRLDGLGYGWDDYMMLIVLAVLVAHEVMVAFSER